MGLEELEPQSSIKTTGVTMSAMADLVEHVDVVLGLHQLLHLSRELKLRKSESSSYKFDSGCYHEVHTDSI